MTNDQEILNLIKGWDIPFIEIPAETHTQNSFITRDDHSLIDHEVAEMLEKGAITQTSYVRSCPVYSFEKRKTVHRDPYQT